MTKGLDRRDAPFDRMAEMSTVSFRSNSSNERIAVLTLIRFLVWRCRGVPRVSGRWFTLAAHRVAPTTVWPRGRLLRTRVGRSDGVSSRLLHRRRQVHFGRVIWIGLTSRWTRWPCGRFRRFDEGALVLATLNGFQQHVCFVHCVSANTFRLENHCRCGALGLGEEDRGGLEG